MKSNTKKLAARYLLWALVLAVMVFIFAHSAETAEQSSATSGEFVKTVLTAVIKDFKDLPEAQQKQAVDSLQFIARKGAHFSIYLVLGSLCFLAMNTYNVKLKTKFSAALAISFIYAISDEVHQFFVPGRAGQIRDVLIDFSGSLTGVALVWVFILIFRIVTKRGVFYEQKTAYK